MSEVKEKKVAMGVQVTPSFKKVVEDFCEAHGLGYSDFMRESMEWRMAGKANNDQPPLPEMGERASPAIDLDSLRQLVREELYLHAVLVLSGWNRVQNTEQAKAVAQTYLTGVLAKEVMP